MILNWGPFDLTSFRWGFVSTFEVVPTPHVRCFQAMSFPRPAVRPVPLPGQVAPAASRGPRSSPRASVLEDTGGAQNGSLNGTLVGFREPKETHIRCLLGNLVGFQLGNKYIRWLKGNQL